MVDQTSEDNIRHDERGAVCRLVTKSIMKDQDHDYSWTCECEHCEQVRDVIKFVSAGLDLLDDERHAPPDFSEEEKRASGSLTVGDFHRWREKGAPGLNQSIEEEQITREQINERGQ